MNDIKAEIAKLEACENDLKECEDKVKKCKDAIQNDDTDAYFQNAYQGSKDVKKEKRAEFLVEEEIHLMKIGNHLRTKENQLRAEKSILDERLNNARQGSLVNIRRPV
ncbi:unnamed protein product [Cylindrotheca closterium]|uniref:Uncharacterized protein n=1 Tax=Cylindrotheca closterium TaxID=2856 RepID=A0AAD2FN24_9STRA|nr:unnamed protein product [Cylindrotheca closterium]